MRQRWVATIIRLSGFIYKKKSGLLTAHSLQSFVDVLVIIVAEIVLAILSLPLYVVSKPISSQSTGVVQYKIRRVVTLSVLFALFMAWIIKLGFLVVTETVILPANPVTISETQVVESEKERIVRELTVADIAEDLAAPEIVKVSQDTAQGLLQVEGKAPANTYVALYVSPAGSGNFTVLLTQASSEGVWMLEQKTGIAGFKPGDYTLSALAFEDDQDEKSEISETAGIMIENPILLNIYKNLDSLLNYIVIAFVVIGIFLTLLTV